MNLLFYKKYRSVHIKYMYVLDPGAYFSYTYYFRSCDEFANKIRQGGSVARLDVPSSEEVV